VKDNLYIISVYTYYSSFEYSFKVMEEIFVTKFNKHPQKPHRKRVSNFTKLDLEQYLAVDLLLLIKKPKPVVEFEL